MVYKKLTIYVLIIFSGLAFGSCTDQKTDTVVAEVGLKKLYLTEVEQVIPDQLQKEDSAILAADYIRKWVKQELLILKANENLSLEEKNLNKEIEEYRNSLIIYKYKNALISQQMDTLVTSNQIQQYYNSNPGTFKLNNNIVKAIFVKVQKDATDSKQLKTLIDNSSEDGIDQLREFCLQYATVFDFFGDNWIDFALVKNNIPELDFNENEYFSRRNVIEVKDAQFYYFVKIRDFKLKNELAPLEYVESNIKDLILNKRKVDFLKQIEDNVYKEGVRQNKFKVY